MVFVRLQKSPEMIKRDNSHNFSRFVVKARHVYHLGIIRSLIVESFPSVLPKRSI
jgi:hypothetical protein